MPTHYNGTIEETRALNAYIKFTRAFDSVSQFLSRNFRKYGITESQFGVLEILYHLGPTEQHTIAEKLLRSGGNITFVIDKLETAQLVKRTSKIGDRRASVVQLTQQGKKLIRKNFPKYLKEIVVAVSNLLPSEQDELGRLSKKMSLGFIKSKEKEK